MIEILNKGMVSASSLAVGFAAFLYQDGRLPSTKKRWHAVARRCYPSTGIVAFVYNREACSIVGEKTQQRGAFIPEKV